MNSDAKIGMYNKFWPRGLIIVAVDSSIACLKQANSDVPADPSQRV